MPPSSSTARLARAGLLVALGCLTTIDAAAQTVPGAGRPSAPTVAAPTTLAVQGDVASPLTLTPADVRTLPRTRVEVTDEGRVVTYEGVLVAELLKQAGVPLGADLRGDAVATYVVAHAADGYRALFALPELDPAFTAADVLVADTIDGKPLFAYQGPWRIVVPKDRRGARSVRMLARIDVVRLR